MEHKLKVPMLLLQLQAEMYTEWFLQMPIAGLCLYIPEEKNNNLDSTLVELLKIESDEFGEKKLTLWDCEKDVNRAYW